MSVTLELSPAQVPDFSCTPELKDGALKLVFVGTGDGSAIQLLADYLKRVHAEATRLTLREVSCDFQRLMFMNSSCFKAFVMWIDTVKNAAQPYRIRFVTEPEQHWQRRSLEALRRLAGSVVTVEAAPSA